MPVVGRDDNPLPLHVLLTHTNLADELPGAGQRGFDLEIDWQQLPVVAHAGPQRGAADDGELSIIGIELTQMCWLSIITPPSCQILNSFPAPSNRSIFSHASRLAK